MGVSGFYKHLIQSFPNLNNVLDILEQMEKKFLYIDFNGTIHPSVGKIISKYENKENIDRREMEKEMFEQIKKDTDKLIHKIKPDFLMIAIDGVAPRAKMQQQRLRRYKSIIEKPERRKIFDTNAISPGTLFMKRLSKYIKEYTDTLPCKVLFLDANIPGEGEHKIIRFIKDFKHSDRVTHIINGLDADLIMLSMSTGINNIYLLREKQHFEYKMENAKKEREKINGSNVENDIDMDIEEYNLLSIDKLKDYYWNDINKQFKYSQFITKQQFINDLIFLCFFAGNDFLDHLKIISIHKNGIELLIEKYLEKVKNLETSLLDKNYKINQTFLIGMLRDFYENEEEYIKKVNNKSQDKIVKYYEPGWKHRYYNYYSNGYYTQKSIKDMCKNYCDMLVWVTKYYFLGTENWSWYYMYDCPPCFSDLYEFLLTYDLNKIHIPKDEPYTQNQQLMIILPPKSSFLIPNQYSHLMYGRLRRFYLHGRMELDKVDKFARYQWKPFLPYIDDNILKAYVI